MRRGLAVMLLGLTACGGKVQSSGSSACELLPAQEITRADTLRFDGIAVSAAGTGALIAWSDAGGLFVRSVDGKGSPKGQALHIGERCRGGLRMLPASTQGYYLACSRPSGEPEQAELALLQLDDQGHRQSERVLGAVGRDGAGVSMARTPTRLLVAYHDGTEGAYAARLSIVSVVGSTEPSAAPIESILLSDLSFAAGAPSVASHGEHWLTAFSETRFGVEATRTRIVLRTDDHASHSLRETLIPDPAPSVGFDAESAFIAYRDRSLKNPKPELHTARLTSRLTLADKPVQIGRANSEGGPSLFACGAQIIALLPRDYASERYIGVHALDRKLSNVGAGHQYYANSRDFVLSDGVCVQGQALLVASERKAPAEPGASLMAMPFRCKRPR